MASARGWLLAASSAAANLSNSVWVCSGVVWVATTWGWFRVRVPVLSKATVRIVPSCSNAAPDLMTTPNLLAEPIAEITVTGTAIASAHGEAATNTTSARSIHVPGSPIRNPNAAIMTAVMSTKGTRGRAIRSARRARSPLVA